MDVEWCSCPHSRFPSQLVDCIYCVHGGLQCLSHQQRHRCQQLWQTLHTEPKQLTIQGLKLRQLRRSDFGFSVSASM